MVCLKQFTYRKDDPQMEYFWCAWNYSSCRKAILKWKYVTCPEQLMRSKTILKRNALCAWSVERFICQKAITKWKNVVPPEQFTLGSMKSDSQMAYMVCLKQFICHSDPQVEIRGVPETFRL